MKKGAQKINGTQDRTLHTVRHRLHVLEAAVTKFPHDFEGWPNNDHKNTLLEGRRVLRGREGGAGEGEGERRGCRPERTHEGKLPMRRRCREDRSSEVNVEMPNLGAQSWARIVGRKVGQNSKSWVEAARAAHDGRTTRVRVRVRTARGMKRRRPYALGREQTQHRAPWTTKTRTSAMMRVP